MTLLYTDPTLKTIFAQGCISSVFKRNHLLKELLAPSLHSNKKFIRTNLMTGCNKCDICKTYIPIISHAVSPIEDIIQGLSFIVIVLTLSI